MGTSSGDKRNPGGVWLETFPYGAQEANAKTTTKRKRVTHNYNTPQPEAEQETLRFSWVALL